MQESLDITLACLRDSEWSVRCDVLEQLGNLGGDALLEPLLAALVDPHLAVSKTALASLGKLGERTPIDVLLATVHDPELVHMAIQSLGARIPMDTLLHCLEQPDLGYTVRRTIQNHQPLEQLPVQPLLDLYARHGQKRGEILLKHGSLDSCPICQNGSTFGAISHI